MAAEGAAALPTLRDLLARAHLRLILFAVLLATLSLMISGMLVVRSYAQRNLDLMASTIAYTVEPAVVFGDHLAAREAMVPIVNRGGVELVEVVDAGGRRLAVWERDHPLVEHRIGLVISGLLWREPAVAEIRRGGQLIGAVRLHGNAEGILRYAVAGMVIALACLVATILAARILARRLQSQLVGPLDHVADVAHAVRTERAFGRRVPSSGIAEIDRLGQDFNALLAELQGWHAGITSENAKLTRQATHDSLTGLGNRMLFEQRIGNAIGDAVRGGSAFAVLYIDVDRFKQINDRHGHDSGDAALIAVADRLRSCIRQIDLAFRLGGDEFCVVLAPLADRGNIDVVVGRIHRAMAEPFLLPDGQMTRADVSIGVAVYPDDGVSPQDLLRRADAAMYRQKKERRHGRGNEGTVNA